MASKSPVLLEDDHVIDLQVGSSSLPLCPSLKGVQILPGPPGPKMLNHGLNHVPFLEQAGIHRHSDVDRVSSRRLEEKEMTSCEGGQTIWIVAGCGENGP